VAARILGELCTTGDRQMPGNGDGYFRAFLPTLGIGSSRKQIEKPQTASFFCLRNRHWMIIGLDTGYNSVGLSSIFSMCKLEDVFLDWLHDLVQPKDFAGAIILLGHHPYCSAFERGYVRPATQLKGLLGDRSVLWFWVLQISPLLGPNLRWNSSRCLAFCSRIILRSCVKPGNPKRATYMEPASQ